MLVKNFKPLLYFGNNLGTFKNVLGEEVNAKNYLDKLTVNDNYVYSTTTGAALNGHTLYGTARSFDYTITTATNSFTDELTTYNWNNVVMGTTSDQYVTFDLQASGFVIFVGTGDTPVTAEDYKLDAPISLNVMNASCIQNSDGTVVITRTFTNNTSNEVVIKEKGLYIFSNKYNPTRPATHATPIVMIGRKVLDTPVTIPVGASYAFTTIIDMSQITFSEADNA